MTSPSKQSPSFSVFYAGDAYSTSQKIMGRQSAGKQFLSGLAMKYPEGRITALGPKPQGRAAIEQQLRQGGHLGAVGFDVLPRAEELKRIGTLYYPAPPTRELVHWRQQLQCNFEFSVMGVTHTLSSKGASDQISDLVIPPFQDWDALICTSKAAKRFAETIQEEMRAYLRESLGATRFSRPLLPLIPLGVDSRAYSKDDKVRAEAREGLGLNEDDIVFLFAGRLSFHAKANPIPMYWALEQAAMEIKEKGAPAEVERGSRLRGESGSAQKVVCLEAGVFPNEHIKASFFAAQAAIAPHVRFIHVDGQDESAYSTTWKAADVFVSLSDNIQETFGLTPVEAMAAGLPVLISDWNGYQDTVRHEVDGFRVPTIQAPAGAGELLALRYTMDVDTYDMYIGRASLATVVDPMSLANCTRALASDRDLRKRMGAEGKRRASECFDWQVILDRYDDLALELQQIRQAEQIRHAAKTSPGVSWPARADPFKRFSHFSSGPIQSSWVVGLSPGAVKRFELIASLSAANYGFDEQLLPKQIVETWFNQIAELEHIQLSNLITRMGGLTESSICALMWLWKFDLIRMSES